MKVIKTDHYKKVKISNLIGIDNDPNIAKLHQSNPQFVEFLQKNSPQEVEKLKQNPAAVDEFIQYPHKANWIMSKMKETNPYGQPQNWLDSFLSGLIDWVLMAL